MGNAWIPCGPGMSSKPLSRVWGTTSVAATVDWLRVLLLRVICASFRRQWRILVFCIVSTEKGVMIIIAINGIGAKNIPVFIKYWQFYCNTFLYPDIAVSTYTIFSWYPFRLGVLFCCKIAKQYFFLWTISYVPQYQQLTRALLMTVVIKRS